MSLKKISPGSLSKNSYLEVIKIFLNEGWTVGQIAASLGKSYVTIYQAIRKNNIAMPNYSGRRMKKEQRRLVRKLLLTTDMTHSQIAETVGCSKHAVWLRAQEMRKSQTDKAGDFQPTTLAEPKRCKVHGLVNIWPCVACSAQGSDTPG